MLHQHVHRLYTKVLVARNVDICKQMELNSQHDSNCFISFCMLVSLSSHHHLMLRNGRNGRVEKFSSTITFGNVSNAFHM